MDISLLFIIMLFKVIKKLFMLEITVLRSAKGTLLAGLNLAKSYETVPDVKIVQKLLDTIYFPPSCVEKTMKHLKIL